MSNKIGDAIAELGIALMWLYIWRDFDTAVRNTIMLERIKELAHPIPWDTRQ